MNTQNKHLPKIEVLHDAFPYQRQAFEELKDLKYSAIFHEQGLGKTKIAADLMNYWLKNHLVDTVLIVTKKMLLANWDKELYFHLKIHPLTLNSDPMNNYFVLNSPAQIITTNFETIISEKNRIATFSRAKRVAIIIDESAKIKNPSTKITQVLTSLRELFSIRVIMSGTPIANRPYDIWSQIFFLDGGETLGLDFEEFKKTSDLSNDFPNQKEMRDAYENSVASIFEKISSFTVRETKNSNTSISLPSKIYSDIVVPLSPVQKDMYLRVKEEMCLEVIRGNKSILDDSSSSLKRIMRLIQIASFPPLVDEGYSEISSKESKLDDLIASITSRDEKCIVWSQFIQVVDYFTKKYKPLDAVKIHGKLNITERNKAVEKFQNGKSKILFATPQSAKEGLTLTTANNAIFYDRSLNLDDYLQAQDRIHRISQNKTCHIYNLIGEETIDVWISKLLEAKSLSAAMGLNDIGIDEYKENIDYSFGDLIKDVLGLGKND